METYPVRNIYGTLSSVCGQLPDAALFFRTRAIAYYNICLLYADSTLPDAALFFLEHVLSHNNILLCSCEAISKVLHGVPDCLHGTSLYRLHASSS